MMSYMLINYYGERRESNKSAIQAVMVNKVGDVGMMVAMISEGSRRGEMNGIEGEGSEVVKWGVIIGMSAKSAQSIGMGWLMNAMSGPTPVSAIIHSSSMVVVGVYMMERVGGNEKVGIIGMMTVIMSGIGSVKSKDVKRMVAWTTSTQLGIMAMGVGGKGMMDHIMNHGMYKSMMFLVSGMIIGKMREMQDERRMGGIGGISEKEYGVIMVGMMSMIGMPYMSNMYSKEMIMDE